MRTLLAALAACLLFLGSASAETVLATWYGPRFEGRHMADGLRFSSADASIAAHCSLPFGTTLQLTNTENGRSIAVTVQDRGPYIHVSRRRKVCRPHGLDLSRAAAQALGFENAGTALLDMEVGDTIPTT
jgi:rare lipoprotein A